MKNRRVVVVSAALLTALAVVAFFPMKKYREEREVDDLLTGVEAEVVGWDAGSLTLTLKFAGSGSVRLSRAKISLPGSSVRVTKYSSQKCANVVQETLEEGSYELADAFRPGDSVEVAAKRHVLSESVPNEFEVNYVVNETPKGCEN